MDLGIYLKFFNLLEDECSQLDIKIIMMLAEKDSKVENENQQKQIDAYKELLQLEKRIGSISNQIQFLSDAIHVQIMNTPENEALVREIYSETLNKLHVELNEKVCFSYKF